MLLSIAYSHGFFQPRAKVLIPFVTESYAFWFFSFVALDGIIGVR
jgi:hypothetical protein